MAKDSGWVDGLRLGADGKWLCRFKLNGRIYQESTGQTSRNAAIRWVNAYKANIANGEMGILACPTFKRGWETMIAALDGKVSTSQIARLRAAERHFMPALGNIPADQITSEDINRVLKAYLNGFSERPMHQQGEHTAKKHTKHGANTLIRIIRQPFNFLIREGFLKKCRISKSLKWPNLIGPLCRSNWKKSFSRKSTGQETSTSPLPAVPCSGWDCGNPRPSKCAGRALGGIARNTLPVRQQWTKPRAVKPKAFPWKRDCKHSSCV